MAELLPTMRTYLIAKAGVKTAFGSTLTRIYADRVDAKIVSVTRLR